MTSSALPLPCCPLCEQPTDLLYAKHPGYQEPVTYDLLHCRRCDTSFASPHGDEKGIYDTIYRQADSIAGYSRYSTYAKAILHKDDPLAYLAASDECYWGVAQRLQAIFAQTSAKSVLEIGSGLGYLTHSLRRKGYIAVGLDASSVAVERAKARFGDYYQCADLHRFATEHPGAFSVVILTEVIEHIRDPEAFLRSALALLDNGGSLIVTTPNKSVYPPGTVWESDLPPVHWWWFSEASMQQLASNLGCTVDFTNYTEFNREHPRNLEVIPSGVPSRQPVLSCAGAVVRGGASRWRTQLRTVLDRLGLLELARRIRRGSETSSRLQGPKSFTLCATFRKK